ncbi:hypothetical protein BH18ACI5_BH18ACI5_04440 [soil metagenome]
MGRQSKQKQHVRDEVAAALKASDAMTPDALGVMSSAVDVALSVVTLAQYFAALASNGQKPGPAELAAAEEIYAMVRQLKTTRDGFAARFAVSE